MRQELTPKESAEVFTLLNIVKDQEALGDVIEVRMLQLLQKKESMGVRFSKEGEKEIRTLHAHVYSCIELLTDSVESSDPAQAAAVLEKIKEFDLLERETEHHHLERIQHMVSVSETSHDMHMELVDALKQILLYSKAIAKNLRTLA